MNPNALKWLVAGVLVLLCVACGNGEPAGTVPSGQAVAQETSIDPCALLTSEEIETVLGWKVDTAESKSYGATGTCTWSSATPFAAAGWQQLSLVLGYGAPDLSSSEAMAKWRFEQYSGDAPEGLKVLVLPVEGLGVPAIQSGPEAFFGIELLVGSKLLTLSPFKTLEPARSLAEKALARM